MLFEELKFDAVDFYETFTPIKKDVTVPSNLLEFTEAMSKHHRLDLNVKTTEPILSESKINPLSCAKAQQKFKKTKYVTTL